MITPRQTRLLRVPDLAGMQRALIDLAIRRADGFVVVPTRAAGRELMRTLHTDTRALIIGTRADLYAALAARLPGLPRLLGPHEREVLAGAIARDVDGEGIRPPFHVRPVLVAEMLALYDLIRRQGRTVADFERNIGGELELSADSDRGAARLLDQTRFLAEVYRRYEVRLAGLGVHDEHLLRDTLIARPAPSPLRHVTVTVADRTADPEGLWPVDFMLLARLPGLEELDVICDRSDAVGGMARAARRGFARHRRNQAGPSAVPPLDSRHPAGGNDQPGGPARPLLTRSRGRARAGRTADQGRAAGGARGRSIAPPWSSAARCRISTWPAKCWAGRAFRSRRSIACRWRRNRTRRRSISCSTPPPAGSPASP